MSAQKNVVIIGGHGKVALRLAQLISWSATVHSVIRDESQSQDIREAGGTPIVLSLEDDPVEKFTDVFVNTNADVVYFSAGSGGKGGEERTIKVDYEGAVKIFDAIEAVAKVDAGRKNPRLILVSAVDIRNPDKIPGHYNDNDKSQSERIRKVITAYMKWKYEADKNLVDRDAFKWTILRPGGLTENPGTGKASIGRTHLSPTIARDDVALALSLLLDREDAAGLAIDIVGGDTPVNDGLDSFIAKGVTDWLG